MLPAEKSNRPKRPDKEVPLVIYKSGERIEIGHAILKGDGSIIGQVAKDVKKEISELLFGNLGDVSLNPKLPPDVQYSTYFKGTPGRPGEPVETAVILPLKVQE